MKEARIESFSARITDKYIFIMLVLFPLFTGFQGYSNITLSKYIFFVCVTALWLACLLIGEIRAKSKFTVRGLSLAGLLVLLYLIVCCLSSAFSSDALASLIGAGRFDGLVTTVLCVCIFFGVSAFSRPKKAYIYAAAVSCSLCCVVAVLQIFGYNPLFLFPEDYNFYDAGIKFSSAFLGTIGNADLFAAYLCLVLPLVSVYYITAEARPLMLLPAVVLIAFCLFVSGVSGGILALGVTLLVAVPFIITNGERLRRACEISALICLAVFFAVSFHAEENAGISFEFSYLSEISLALAAVSCLLRAALRKAQFRQNTLRLFFLTLSAVAFLSSLAVAYFWRGTVGSVYEFSQLLHGNLSDSFGSSRILIWRKTLELFPEHPLLGGGPGTLALRLDVSFSRFVEETGQTLSSSVDNAHNDYLGILVNTGTLALISYVAAQCVSLFKSAKAAKASEFCGCLACGMLCYWVQAFFGLGLFLVSPVMWLMWGLLISSLRSAKN